MKNRKHIIASKTFWLGIATIAASIGELIYNDAVRFNPSGPGKVGIGIGIGIIVLRFVTSGAVRIMPGGQIKDETEKPKHKN